MFDFLPNRAVSRGVKILWILENPWPPIMSLSAAVPIILKSQGPGKYFFFEKHVYICT